MKNLFIYIALTIGLVACSGEETAIETTDLAPLLNMYGEDSLDLEGNIVYGNAQQSEAEDDLGYRLGPESDIPLVTIYGEDSVDVDGNYVYPSRDTLWN